jgi:hypothetical protein
MRAGVAGIGAGDTDAVDLTVDIDGHREFIVRPIDRPAPRAAQAHRVVHIEMIGRRGCMGGGWSALVVSTP